LSKGPPFAAQLVLATFGFPRASRKFLDGFQKIPEAPKKLPEGSQKLRIERNKRQHFEETYGIIAWIRCATASQENGKGACVILSCLLSRKPTPKQGVVTCAVSCPVNAQAVVYGETDKALAKHEGRRVCVLRRHQNGAPEGLSAVDKLFVSWAPPGRQLLAELLLAVILEDLDDFGPEPLCSAMWTAPPPLSPS